MKQSLGFTLFELLVVMLIVGIFAAIGIPSFQYVTSSNRIATELNNLVGDIQFARTEAVKEGLPVTVCVSTDGATCSTTSTNWNKGWIVFADSNGNHTVDNGEPVLRKQAAFSADTFVADNNFGWATYNRNGFAATGTTSTVTVTLHAPNNTSQWTRCLAVSPVGMLAVEKSGQGNCT